jgi:outer membrane protein OmpA-like peptidoglycan-associated protein
MIFSPINANITAINVNNSTTLTAQKQKMPGNFILKLPVDNKYIIHIEDSGYNPQSFTFNLDKLIYYADYEEDIALIADYEICYINIEYVLKDADYKDIRFKLLNENIDELADVENINDGEYIANLRKNGHYYFTVKQKGYSFNSRYIVAGTDGIGNMTHIKLVPLAKQIKIALPTVKFEPNSMDIKAESYKELDDLIELMIDNPEVTIEVAVYININNEDYSARLSANMARKLAEYLTFKGKIIKGRITSNGYYGQNAPIDLYYTESEPDDKKTNLLVWFKVTNPAKEMAKLVIPQPATNNKDTEKNKK